MREDLDQSLCREFPKLFVSRMGNPLSALGSGAGLEIGDGWYQIVRDLSREIQDYVDQHHPNVSQPRILQIKEKFGALRYYISHTDEAIMKMIAKYEGRSEETCEICGEPGQLSDDGWIKTLCERHAKERSEGLRE